MKTLKNISLAAAALALPLWAAQAMAVSIPTFHVDHGSSYYVGTATVSATDVCKFKQSYENAEWGTVLDDSDNSVGFGLVSPEGVLIALLNSEPTQVSGIDTSHKTERTYYLDVVNENLSALIGNATESTDCLNALLIADAKSRMTTTSSEEGDKVSAEVKFDGIAAPKEVDGNGSAQYKKQLFSGKVTFKSKIPVLK